MPLVAVYGTLRKGLWNHRLMERGGAEKLGTVRLSPFEMYSAGGFPVIYHAENDDSNDGQVITAEVYRVPTPVLEGPLDSLEGHPRWYRREQIMTEFGRAWIYVMQDERYKANTKAESGDWVDFYNNGSDV